MFRNHYKRSCQALLLALSLLPVVSGALVPLFKDRGEYDIAAQVERERDPVNCLVLLNRWVKLYPNSAFEQERDNRLIKTYRDLKMGWLMLDAARHMAAEDPRGLGNYWIALLTIGLQDSSPSGLVEGRAAAEAMLRNSATSFALSNYPTSVPREVWLNERDRQVTLAHRTLGWVDLQQDRFRDAEREFATVLRSSPNDAEASFWLSKALIGQNDPSRQTAAIHAIAKSLAVKGAGELLPEARGLVKMSYDAENANLPLLSFALPVRGPQQIPEPPEASVLYPAPGAAASYSEVTTASRGALLVRPIMDVVSP